MAGSFMKWRGDAANKKIRGRLKLNAKAAALIGANAVKQKLSTPWPPASSPGESPHLRTGTLRRGTIGKVDDEGTTIVILIGVKGVPYAPELEFGLAGKAARPFLRPAILENQQAIFKALSAGF